MKNLKSNSIHWVLIRHYWKSMKQWFPIWISYSQMSEDTFTPATQFEKETFGCCIKSNQIMAFEDNVTDRSSAFKDAFLLLQKESKKEQKESELS